MPRLAMVVTPHIRAQRLEISAFTQSASTRDQSIERHGRTGLRFRPGQAGSLSAALVDRGRHRVGALSVAAHAVLAELLGLLAWLAMPVIWVFLSRSFFGWFDRRQRERLLAQFPDALAMIVRSVRVGIPVQEAIRTVAREAPQPTGDEFSRLVNQVAVGVVDG